MVMTRRIPEVRTKNDASGLQDKPFCKITSQSGRPIELSLQRWVPQISLSASSDWEELNTYGDTRPLNWTGNSPIRLRLDNCLIDGEFNSTVTQYIECLQLMVKKDRAVDSEPPLFKVAIGQRAFINMALFRFDCNESLHIPGTGHPSRVIFSVEFVKQKTA